MAISGRGICGPFGDFLIIEYCPNESFARLPSVFPRLFPNHAPMNAVLLDPVGNPNHVLVARFGNDFYFTDGWAHLRRVYGIDFNAWICLVYVRPATFEMTIRDLKWVEWIYPPVPEPLEGGDGYDGVSMFALGEERLIANKRMFPYMLVKFVSFAEFTGDVFVLPPGFYEPALVDPESTVYIVDEMGKRWPCILRRGYGSQNKDAVITKGWARFCRRKGFQQDQRISFGVAYPKSNKLHYIPNV